MQPASNDTVVESRRGVDDAEKQGKSFDGREQRRGVDSGKNKRTWIENAYTKMNEHFGDLHWWPAETPFEMAVGAILTQNTAWTNASRAVEKLRGAGLLDPFSLYQADWRHIAEAVHPAGFYNIKTDRLKAFVDFLRECYGGDIEAMFAEETDRLRELLLSVRGIGKETADSIMLYGDNRPVFVVDAYTKRILERHGVVDQGWTYDDVQRLFVENLPCKAALFNQYHALLVNTGKLFCRSSPRCDDCPLRDM